jgi:hypothetical protein
MANHIIKADFLQAVDPAGDTYPSGQPKVIQEFTEGDSVDLTFAGDERIQDWVDHGAIELEPDDGTQADSGTKGTSSS